MPRPSAIPSVLLALLLWPGPLRAEIVDRSIQIDASGQVTQLAASAQALTTENRNAVAGGAADLNGDGSLDVIVWHRLPEEAPICLLNDGQAHLAPAPSGTLPSLTSGETETAVLVDLDGDGALDAYLGRLPTDQVWLNDGRGVFSDGSAQWLPDGWGGTTGIAVGDLTGDQRPDVVVVQGGTVRVLENRLGNVLREITDQVFLAGAPQGVSHLLLFDADGDADVDLLTASPRALQLFLNDHAQLSALRSQLNPRGLPVTGMAAGDLDGDGDPDVIVSRQGFPLYMDNRGGGQFFVRYLSVQITGFSNGVTLADLNADQRLDILLPITGPNEVLLNPGPGGLWAPTPNWLPPDNEASRAGLVGDFNVDGQLDIYVANDGQDQFYLQLSPSTPATP